MRAHHIRWVCRDRGRGIGDCSKSKGGEAGIEVIGSVGKEIGRVVGMESGGLGGMCVNCGKGGTTTRRGGSNRGVAKTALAGARTRSRVGRGAVTV